MYVEQEQHHQGVKKKEWMEDEVLQVERKEE
jgi:hypothetical protein